VIEEGVLLLRQEGANVVPKGRDPERVVSVEPIGEIDKGF
jgi:hypothetical protein